MSVRLPEFQAPVEGMASETLLSGAAMVASMNAGAGAGIVAAEAGCFAVVRRYPSRMKTATLPVATLLAAVLGDSSQVSTE